MTRSQERACWVRRGILVLGVLFTLGGVIWALLPLLYEESNYAGLSGTVLIYNKLVDTKLAYFINVVIIIGLILLGQWAFLRPGKGWKVKVNEVGRPLKTSVFAAAMAAMLLTVGLISLLLELPNWWEKIMDAESHLFAFGVWAAMMVIWGIWAWVFFVYWKQGDRYTQMGKMIRGLVAGSILEIIVAVPVHIWATKQRECYCCRGSYTTLVLSAVVLIWAFGPGIILLYMRQRNRVEKLDAFVQNEHGEEEKTLPEDNV